MKENGLGINSALPSSDAKIKGIDALLEWVSAQKIAGSSIGFTCGAFDLLHAGHVDYLQKARQLCDQLIIAVNSDESIRSYKNPLRPINSEWNRMKVIAALECVDAVTLMADLRPANLISTIKPDLYIKGGDYSKDNLRSAPLVESYGGRCALIPVEHETSTTTVIRKIEEIGLHEMVAKPKTGRSRLVLLDRDGTIIENVPFLADPAAVRLLPGVGEGLRTLQDEGFTLVIVTNQQGIGIGYFDYADFVAVNSEMFRQLSKFGVKIARVYFCPHSHAEDCSCRKPGAELVERALKHFGCEPSESYLIGDSTTDIEAASRAGCHGILVNQSTADKSGDAVSTTFTEAVNLIVNKVPQPA